MNQVKKIAITAIAAGVAVLAAITITNIDDIILTNLNTLPTIELDTQLQTYDINSECELLYLFFNGFNPHEGRDKFSFTEYMTEDFLARKYPNVLEKLKEYYGDPKNISTVLQFQGRGGAIPSEIADIFSEIIMEELSVNPKIKPELLRILTGQVSAEEKYLIGSVSHPCEKEIQSKRTKYDVPLNYDLEFEDFFAQAEDKRKELVKPVEVNYLKMLRGEIPTGKFIQETRIILHNLNFLYLHAAEKRPTYEQSHIADPVHRGLSNSIEKVLRAIIVAKMIRDGFPEDEIEKLMGFSLELLFDNKTKL